MIWLLVGCAAAVAALTAHTAVNAALLRRPPPAPSTVDEPVAVLVPARDEAHRIAPCLRALLSQEGVPRLEILVLDDGSTDGTAGVVARNGVRAVTGAPLRPGWLGKSHACAQLADLASGAKTLVFLDADVVLAPHAVAAAVHLLRANGFDLLSPYPRIVGAGERLVQPLLPWSWLTFLPLRAMERSPRPALAAAGGQFLVVDRAAYERAGGHGGVRDRVLEDVELARAVKRAGGRIALADGSGLATCRMYDSWRELADGYAKSLWAAFGSAGGAAAVVLLLLVLYAVPPALGLTAAATGGYGAATAGLSAYILGVVGRVVAAGGRRWTDALAQPLSIVVFAALVVRSFRRRRGGRLAWKGRAV